MTTEGIRAAAAAFANVSALHDEERKKIELTLRENVHKPYLFLAIPALMGPTAYRKFVEGELAETGLLVDVADDECVVIARSKDAIDKGRADYRDRKIKYTMGKFLGL